MRMLVVFLMLFAAGNGFAGEPQNDILVTPDWLEAHLSDASLVVIQLADSRLDYMRGHIPGARFLWPGWIEKSGPEMSVELYPIEKMVSVLEDLGISNSSEIVLCHTYTMFNAACTARTWAMLDHLGMGGQTRILNGGFEAWNVQGKPVTKEIPEFARGTFTPNVKEDVFVNLDYTNDRRSDEKVKVVDLRRAKDFQGHAKGVIRAGHIPGAVNLPSSAIIDKALCYGSVEALETELAEAGIERGDKIISYCHKGRSACFAYVVGKMLGYEVHVYDGSAEEWCGRDDVPIAVSAVKSP